MIDRIRRLRRITLAAAVMMTAGRGLDLRWHATHDEFETGADQLQAHWLAWLGALLLLTTALVATRPVYRSPGYAVLLVSGASYAVVAVWHFSLHQQLRDPTFPTCCCPLAARALHRISHDRRRPGDPEMQGQVHPCASSGVGHHLASSRAASSTPCRRRHGWRQAS